MHHLQRVDLNLLVAFDVLMAERSVTRAAERLAVGQSAMSASLARLRKLFDDALLVRDGRALVPTPLAESLVGQIREALSVMEAVLEERRTFDPRLEKRTFTIGTSDYVLAVLLGPLLTQLRAEAPYVRINVRPIYSNYADRLRRGLIDLFILARELEHSGVAHRSEDLFTDRMVCAVDIDNPDVGESMTEEQFLTLPYLAYDSGDSLPTVVQQQLRVQGIDRSIDVTTQSFVVAPMLLRGTPFFTVIHERLGHAFTEQGHVRLVESPVEFGPVTEAMFWSQRLENSPAHRWLRHRIREAAAEIC